MTSPWTIALVSLALVMMLLSFKTPRAWRWIGIGGLSFFATTLFYDYGDKQMHPIFTLASDALCALLIYRGYREDWEIFVFLAFLASVFSSVLMLGGFITADWIYASLLELCNAGALLWIGTTGVIDMVGKNENSALHAFRARLHHARHSLP